MQHKGCLGSIGWFLAWIGFEVALWVLAPILVMVCFFFFDLFHITQTWMQVSLVISPLLVLAFFHWRSEEKKQLQGISTQTPEGPDKAHPSEPKSV